MFSDEHVKLQNPRKTLWKWMLSYLKPFYKRYIIYFILLMISTLILAITPIITSNIIDQGIIAGNMNYLIQLSLLLLVLTIITALSNYISSYEMGKMGQIITYNVRNDVFDQLQKMSMSFFDSHHSGDIISITTNDVDQLNTLVSQQLLILITSFVSIALYIVFMYILNPILASVSLVIFPIFYLSLYFFKKAISGPYKKTRLTISRVTSSIQENIAGAKVVKAYGQETKTLNEFDKTNIENYYAGVRVRTIFATFFPLIIFFTQFITAGVILLGGFSVLGNITIFGISVTVGVLTAFITFLAQFFRPFMNVLQIQQIIESALAAADRIYTIIKEEVDLPDPIKPKHIKKISGNIIFENVSFGYPLMEQSEIATGIDSEETTNKSKYKPKKGKMENIQYVLKNINLNIEPGKTLAIVGETGTGKTTLIKLIARFYDVTSGSIKIDGVDIREITKKDLRDLIGIVPQDSFLFTGTIKDNLLYGIKNPTIEDENRIIEVTKLLGLHNFIEVLPKKYNAMLIENGSNISIGQRQLMAFARALVADPKILILDEATSSVDPYTETLIQEAIDKARQNRTTIIIAHRLSTIKKADNIIVMSKEEKGIIEQGTHNELIRIPNSKYRHLLEMQSKEMKKII